MGGVIVYGSQLGDFIPKTEFSVSISEMPDSPGFRGRKGRGTVREDTGYGV